ncbi:MAG: hypothetical protein ACLQVJ_27830 [Syntrophobacteraceae bacterium]
MNQNHQAANLKDSVPAASSNIKTLRCAEQLMPDLENLREIHELYRTIYEQSLLFLAMKTRPGCETKLAETRERIIRLYNTIRSGDISSSCCG